MKQSTTREILGSTEEMALQAQSLHERLKELGLTILARDARVIQLEALRVVHSMGHDLSVEVTLE
jgi:hypothetical protein